MASPPMQPPTPNLPQPAAAAALEGDRLRELVALLHTPQGAGQNLERQAEALDVEGIIQQLPPQPPPQYGELPGEGYLFARAPQVRQAAMVDSTPDTARAALLRAIEVCGINALLPFSEKGPNEWGRAALEFAQAYLLLDPSVDESGVPVGAQAQAQGQAQEAVAHAQGQATLENTHAQHDRQERLETLKAAAQLHFGGGETFTHPTTDSGHALPPRVADNAAEAQIKEAHKNAEEIIRGVRADRPRPQPRVGQ